ncbi:MAG: DNA primase [Desulfohalobiaceae bacterium]|nr:DNA primase [Desulfohalobiaceae bacterium]
MPRISPEKIQEIKSRLDAVAIVQRYIDLKTAGGERWSGVCPFHQETKPSFSLSGASGLYYCFGCQASGDIIDFYCQINGLEFVQAVLELAAEARVDVEGGSGDSSEARLRKTCFQLHELAQSFFRAQLTAEKGAPAREYLQSRNISRDIQELFGLGFAPAGWQFLMNHLRDQGYKSELGVQAGLLSKNDRDRTYDRFRSRITFPIRDLSGRVVAFGGRIVAEGEPKYLNSSESPIFKKGELLYGLFEARKQITQSKTAILTEGYADVLALFKHNFRNACGVLGTALTKTQVRRLSGLCQEALLIFDGDRAGRQAALRSAEMILTYGLKVRVVQLPDDEDVDSFLQKFGEEKLRDLLEKSTEGLAFCLGMITHNNSPRQTMSWATGLLKNLQDPTLQAYYLPRLAAGLGITEPELRAALRPAGPARKEWTKPAGLKHLGRGQIERELLRFAIHCPEYREELGKHDLGQVLQTERGRNLWAKLKDYGHEAILSHLDEGEKRFFIQTRMEWARPADPAVLWEEVRDFLHRRQEQSTRKSLKAAIDKAQQEGNETEVSRLFQEYNKLITREQ